jgi:hypothetical protein
VGDGLRAVLGNNEFAPVLMQPLIILLPLLQRRTNIRFGVPI